MKSKPPKLFLLDVEGTVAPISLVYDQLFPYARAHLVFSTTARRGPERRERPDDAS